MGQSRRKRRIKQQLDLFETTSNNVLTKFASGRPTPGSGSAAAITCGLAAAVTQTAGKILLQKSKRAKFVRAQVRELTSEAHTRRRRVQRWSRQDSEIFQGAVDARNAAKRARRADRKAALETEDRRLTAKAALHVLKIGKEAVAVAHLALQLTEIGCAVGYRAALGESVVGVHNSVAAAYSCAFIAILNAGKTRGRTNDEIRAAANQLMSDAFVIQERIWRISPDSSYLLDTSANRQLSFELD